MSCHVCRAGEAPWFLPTIKLSRKVRIFGLAFQGRGFVSLSATQFTLLVVALGAFWCATLFSGAVQSPGPGLSAPLWSRHARFPVGVLALFFRGESDG